MSYLPDTPDFQVNVIAGAYLALFVAAGTIAGVLLLRVLGKPHWKTVVLALSGVVGGAVGMLMVKPWLPPPGFWRVIIPAACAAAWLGVVLTCWALIQKDVKALGTSIAGVKTELTSLISQRPDHNGVEKLLRTKAGEITEAVATLRKQGDADMALATEVTELTKELRTYRGPSRQEPAAPPTKSRGGIAEIRTISIGWNSQIKKFYCQCLVALFSDEADLKMSPLELTLTDRMGRRELATLKAKAPAKGSGETLYEGDIAASDLTPIVAETMGFAVAEFIIGRLRQGDELAHHYCDVAIKVPDGREADLHAESSVRFTFEKSSQKMKPFVVMVYPWPSESD